jgi:hypothetical protein
MEKIHRRTFCGASLLAFPLMNLFAGEKDLPGVCEESDPVMESLAREFARTTLDGMQNGFGAVHFRQYAGQFRILDALLEANGTNSRLNRKLDEDDFRLLDPDRVIRMTTGYWKKHGIDLNRENLEAQFSMDADSYRQVKLAIKKQGGIRALHESIAEAFERKASEYSGSVLKGGMTIRNGNSRIPASASSACRSFQKVQFDPGQFPLDMQPFIGVQMDCLCRAMVTEGAALSLLCVFGCVPCCVPAAILIAAELLMENNGQCNPKNC